MAGDTPPPALPDADTVFPGDLDGSE
jgi:hypothetical protein